MILVAKRSSKPPCDGCTTVWTCTLTCLRLRWHRLRAFFHFFCCGQNVVITVAITSFFVICIIWGFLQDGHELPMVFIENHRSWSEAIGYRVVVWRDKKYCTRFPYLVSCLTLSKVDGLLERLLERLWVAIRRLRSQVFVDMIIIHTRRMCMSER